MLVKHITGLSDADLIGNDLVELSKNQQLQLDDFITQRQNGRPISKIIGYKEFYGRDFIVTDDVLDPRPDSELLIDIILRHCEEHRDKAIQNRDCSSGLPRSHALLRNDDIQILDLGTGSGCLILTLLAQLPDAKGVATDISGKAIAIARQNAEKIGVQDRVEIIESNWFSAVKGTYDVIISNPPYIETDVVPALAREVSAYDPILALDGGVDGLDPYKVILPQAKKYLNTGGVIALEHGYNQCGRIKRLIENSGFREIRSHRDLGGIDRVLTAIHK